MSSVNTTLRNRKVPISREDNALNHSLYYADIILIYHVGSSIRPQEYYSRGYLVTIATILKIFCNVFFHRTSVEERSAVEGTKTTHSKFISCATSLRVYTSYQLL